MSDTTPEERRITLRIPTILAARMDKDIAEESMNAWIIEAIRRRLDEPGFRTVAGQPPVELRYPSDMTSFAAPASFGNSAKLLEILGKGKSKDPEGRISKVVLPDLAVD